MNISKRLTGIIGGAVLAVSAFIFILLCPFYISTAIADDTAVISILGEDFSSGTVSPIDNVSVNCDTHTITITEDVSYTEDCDFITTSSDLNVVITDGCREISITSAYRFLTAIDSTITITFEGDTTISSDSGGSFAAGNKVVLNSYGDLRIDNSSTATFVTAEGGEIILDSESNLDIVQASTGSFAKGDKITLDSLGNMTVTTQAKSSLLFNATTSMSIKSSGDIEIKGDSVNREAGAFSNCNTTVTTDGNFTVSGLTKDVTPNAIFAKDLTVSKAKEVYLINNSGSLVAGKFTVTNSTSVTCIRATKNTTDPLFLDKVSINSTGDVSLCSKTGSLVAGKVSINSTGNVILSTDEGYVGPVEKVVSTTGSVSITGKTSDYATITCAPDIKAYSDIEITNNAGKCIEVPSTDTNDIKLIGANISLTGNKSDYIIDDDTYHSNNLVINASGDVALLNRDDDYGAIAEYKNATITCSKFTINASAGTTDVTDKLMSGNDCTIAATGDVNISNSKDAPLGNFSKITAGSLTMTANVTNIGVLTCSTDIEVEGAITLKNSSGPCIDTGDTENEISKVYLQGTDVTLSGSCMDVYMITVKDLKIQATGDVEITNKVSNGNSYPGIHSWGKDGEAETDISCKNLNISVKAYGTGDSYMFSNTEININASEAVVLEAGNHIINNSSTSSLNLTAESCTISGDIAASTYLTVGSGLCEIDGNITAPVYLTAESCIFNPKKSSELSISTNGLLICSIPSGYDELLYKTSDSNDDKYRPITDSSYTFSEGLTYLDILAHKHEWQYAVSEDLDTISAYCNNDYCTKSVSKLNDSVSISLSASDATYNGKNYSGATLSQGTTLTGGTNSWTAVGLSLPDISYSGIGDTEYTTSTTAPVDAGTYTASITVGDATISKNFTIAKVDASLTGNPTLASTKALAYDGKSHATVTFNGSVTGGTLYYQAVSTGKSTSDGSWTTAIPQIKEIGSYDIYYKVEGDANHNGIAATKIGTISITDQTAPTASVTFNGNTWKTLQASITFGVKCFAPQTIYVTTADYGLGVASTSCYLSEKAMTASEIKALDASKWTDYTAKGISLATCGQYVIYFKVTDLAGNTTYISTNGIVNEHKYKPTLTKATTSKEGSLVKKCTVCGDVESMPIYRIKSVTISKSAFIYSGKAQKPTVTVKDSKGNVIDAKYYKLTYSKGLKNVGTYTVKITFKGNYTGTVTKSFTIKPKATTLSGLTALSKGLTVKWKKLTTQTTGYQIQYSTSSKFSGAKTLTIAKNTVTSKKITKLTGKKTYYVRIRTYKVVSGKKYYSAWSKAKSAKTKK